MRLKWRALVVGEEDPRYFQFALSGSHFGGWTSRGNPTYPLDIVVGLERKYRIRRIEIGVGEDKIPSRVHVKVGCLSRDVLRRARHATIDYIRASRACYYTGMTRDLEIDPKKRACLHTIYFDGEDEDDDNAEIDEAPNVGEYLWLVVDRPAGDQWKNPRNQIKLTQLHVYGDELSCSRCDDARGNHRRKFLSDSPLLDEMSQLSDEDDDDAFHKRAHRSSLSLGQHSLLSRNARLQHRRSSSQGMRKVEYVRGDGSPEPECPDLTRSPANASMSPSDEPRDLLLRMKGLLCEKFAEHRRAGREFSSSLCQRALRQVEEAEGAVGEIVGVMESAKLRGDRQCENRCHEALHQLLDNLFRINHLDLLIGRRNTERLLPPKPS